MDLLNKDQLSKKLKKMDLPVHRTNFFNKNNLLWLQKNIACRNKNHPDYHMVINTIDNYIDTNNFTQ